MNGLEPAVLSARRGGGRDSVPGAAPVVLKLGGRALESPGSTAGLAGEIAAFAGGALLVHGGGGEVSAWCARLGLEPRFVDGLRVTDQATLEVATAVLAGLANCRLVAALRAHGVDAVGLSALDGGIVEVEPHPDAARLGAVGRVRAVHRALLMSLLAQGRTPVLASIGACRGALLNLNADDLAAALAGALGAGALVLLSDAPGLVIDGALLAHLDGAALDAALAHPQVTGGMRPKLRAARVALAAGARRVHIAAWQGPGTLAAVLSGAAECTTITGAERRGHDSAGPGADETRLLAPVYPLPRLAVVSGRGAWVTGADGRTYLDFVSGLAVNALGHAPAGLARAVARQLRTLAHCSNLFANPPGTALAAALTQATGYERVFFCNSGTEGVEAALKFARARARSLGRAGRDVLAFRGGFHGRTGFSLSATWTPSYREPFEPLVPGVRFADFNHIESLDGALDGDVCAVIVEPVQGEGGAVPATREFLRALRARCTALGAALIFDEVQCGLGRCGRLLAAEHHGVRADLVVLSKALGGGLPLGAVLMTAGVAQALAPGMHGCTFGGGPVVTTAGAWMLERVRNPRFLARVRRRGRELGAGLEAIVARHATLAESRGLGLLRAVEIAGTASFDPATLVAAAREQGLLLVRGGERAVRFLPPLTVTPDEIALALERFEAAVAGLETKGETR